MIRSQKYCHILGRKLGVQRDQNNTNNMIKMIEYLVPEVKKGSGLEKGYKMAWHFFKTFEHFPEDLFHPFFQLFHLEVKSPKKCLDPGFEWGGEDVRFGEILFLMMLQCSCS